MGELMETSGRRTISAADYKYTSEASDKLDEVSRNFRDLLKKGAIEIANGNGVVTEADVENAYKKAIQNKATQ